MKKVLGVTLAAFLGLSIHVPMEHTWTSLEGSFVVVHGHHHGDPHGDSKSSSSHDPVDHDHDSNAAHCKTCSVALHLAGLAPSSSSLIDATASDPVSNPRQRAFPPSRALYLHTQALLI